MRIVQATEDHESVLPTPLSFKTCEKVFHVCVSLRGNCHACVCFHHPFKLQQLLVEVVDCSCLA